MTNLKKDLNDILNLIRNDFPTNTAERVRYIKNVAKCEEMIIAMGKTDLESYHYILERNNLKLMEFIVGWDYSKQPLKSVVEQVKANYSNKCGICSFPITSVLHVHHIIPHRLGGKNDSTNLIAVCPTCHKIFHLIEGSGEVNQELEEYLKNIGCLEIILSFMEHLLIKPGVYQMKFLEDGRLNITP